jgi:acyl-CoA synthetase (AMP-forming)/AMP-acid ligase II
VGAFVICVYIWGKISVREENSMMDLTQVMGLADVVRVQAATLGDKIALSQEGRHTSFAALDARSNQVGQRLRQEWIDPGERVAILSKNCDSFYEIWFGALKARACLTPINIRLAGPEIAYIVNDSEAKILFVGKDFYPLAEQVCADLPNPPKLIALDGGHASWPAYQAWRDVAEAMDPRLDMPDSDDAIQLYTSGTTGHPKGVQLTNKNYRAFLQCAKDVQGFRYEVDERVMNAMPLFHVAGTNVGIAGLAQGARLCIVRDLIPQQVIAILSEEKINHTFFVPAVIQMLLATPELATADLSNLRTVSYGASPISEDVLNRARAAFKCDFLQFYGMTETQGGGTYLPPQAHDPALGKLRSCGIAWPNVQVAVKNPDGSDTPQGQVGEIWIKGGIIMKGYWHKDGATAEAIVDGWMRTGDAAYQDADGYFYIYDRVKDMIVSGGENVYPAEVENAVHGAPGVADVAVIGVPDEKWGEVVKAVVVAKPGENVDPDAVIAWTRERLANYKVPKSVDVVQAIPRNASGKILRRELRKPYWEGKERMVN